MSSVLFNDLPKKVLNSVFQYIDQSERQKLRVVCNFWKRFIDEEFPVELVITQDNFQRLFRCPTAVTVEIQNLTTEYTDAVGFGATVNTIQFTGKVLSSNIFSILKYCSDLQVLRFSSLKQVLGIQDAESIKLPKTKSVEIKVRADQETFTSDEIIVISILRQILFGSLQIVWITTRSPWEEADEIDEDPDSQYFDDNGGETEGFTVATISPLSSSQFNANMSIVGTAIPSLAMSLTSENDDAQENERRQGNTLPVQITPAPNEPAEAGTQTTNTNLHVIINRAANFRGAPANGTTSSNASSSSSTRRVRYNMSEFEARLFYANLEMLVESGTADISEMDILNGSMSQSRLDSASLFEVPGAPIPVVNHTVFFEFLRNNNTSLKSLFVRTRSDFMCFGNISNYSKDFSKVQFEELDYSFGRMQVCSEYTLLRAQTKLKKLKIQIMEDMWKHLALAIEQSRGTLDDLDVKVISVSENRVDLKSIRECQVLKCLKMLHFFEKESLCTLPGTLNKLVINGPISYRNLTLWSKELVELTDLTLLLNTRGDKIDLPLYKKLLKMPKMTKLAFIQCPMELDKIQNYIDTGISSKNGLKFLVNGPKEMKEIPFIQYVHTFIEPENFNRDQIVLDT